MKEREDYRSKKALAIGAGIATAIVVAVGGTVAFIKSRPDSTAVNNVVENQITNTATIDDTTNSTQNVSINEVTNTSTNSTSNKGNTTANNTTNNTTNTTNVVNIVNSNPSTNNGTAKDLNKNTAANKATNTTNNTTADNTKMEEFVQTTVVEGKKNVKVYDERDVEWSPIALAAISGAIEVSKPNIESAKLAYVNGIIVEDMEESYVAHVGDEITYVIKITNNGSKAKTINSYDSIPEGTKLVEGSITNDGVENGGKISWKTTIKAGKTVELSFKVVVEKEITVVKNTATVNGEPTNEVETPVVTSEKVVHVLDSEGNIMDGVTVASAGQRLLYIIRVKNTSKVAGVANVSDTIDTEAITVDEESITEGGNYTDGTITWDNVEVPANGRAKLQFEATVNSDGEFNVISNKANVNGHDTPDAKIPYITIEKKPSVAFAKNNDIYTYSIELTNNSEITGKTTVSDKIPEGTAFVEGSIVGNGKYDDTTKTITWDEVEVKPGTTTVSFNVRVRSATVDAIKNTAKVGDVDVPSDDVPVAKMKVEKTIVDEDSNKEYKVGEKVKYVITVTNLGSKDLSNIVVKDDLTVHDDNNSKVATVTSIKVGNTTLSNVDSYVSTENNDGDAILVITIPTLTVEDKEAEIKLEYEVTAGDVGVGNHKIINSATVKSDEIPDPIPDPKDPEVVTDNYTNVQVSKEWKDNNDQDGKRPDSVRVTLKANGKDADSSMNVSIPSVELNDSNEWKYEWIKVLADIDGKAITYTVEENDVTFEESGETRKYDSKVEVVSTTDRVTTLKVTNTHDPIPYNETPEDPDVKPGTITIKKVWDDKDNQDGKRPESVTVHLIGTIKDDNGADVEVSSAEYQVKKSENWTKTISNLPKYNSGKEITYTVTEDTVDNYTTEAIPAVSDGKVSITNSHTPELYNKNGELTITKSWNDKNNQDGKRPDSITVHVIGTIKNDDGSKKEVSNKEYNITPEDWTIKVTELPKYNSGKEITYTVTENAIENYTIETIPAVKNGAVTITNTHVPEKFNGNGEVTVIKVWEDSNNQDGMRSDIEFTLYANDEVYGVVTLTEDNADKNNPNKWTYTWTELDKYKDGKEIVYTVIETAGNVKYTSTISATVASTGDNAGKATITNTYAVETTSYEVTKIWNDDSNRDGYRADVKIALKADGEVIKTADTSKASTDDIVITKNDDNTWTIKFNNLEVYKAGAVGQKVKYTSEEITDLAQYTEGAEVKSGDYKSTITNSHTTDKTTYTVTKVWDDDNNRDGMQAEEIEVQLYANDTPKGDSIKLNEDNKFTYTWSGLEKNLNGNAIVYRVDEVSVPDGYTKEVTTNGNAATIKNKHISEKHDNIVITKIWEDNNNQDGKRPTTITFNLKAKVNNQYIGDLQQSKTISVSNTGRENAEKATFDNLYKYYNGSLIEYYVSETAVTFMENGVEQTYTTTPAGEVKVENNSITFTNTHDPYKYNGDGEIGVTKVWEDGNNQDGKRVPTDIKLMKQVGTADAVEVTGKVFTAPGTANTETGKYEGLPKYENGIEIVYSVVENQVAGYETPVITGKPETGFTVTNKRTPEKVNGDGEIPVTKVWEDGNNQDGKRVPTDIKLMKQVGTADAVEVTGKVFTAPGTANTETGKYEGLPKYENGTEIVYSVTEAQVAGYETPVITGNQETGFTVTNKHTPELVDGDGEIPVKKIWYDNNNFYKARPASITVTLKENGTVTNNTLTISTEDVVPNTDNNEWQDKFVGLPKYKNGQEIEYSIVENVPNTYESEVTGNYKDGFTITNRYENVDLHRYSLESTEISTEAALVDVVFVLDVSGSMDDNVGTDWLGNPTGHNDRAKNAVAAINEAMASIFAKSQKNRVSVVTYSAGGKGSRDNAKVLLPLKSYKPSVDGGNYLQFTSNSGYQDDKISISVKEVLDDGSTQNVPAGTATTVTGGTYTQAGIKKGADVLINAPNKKYTIGNDEYTRAAVMILLTDGEPTFGKNNVPLSNSNNDVSGDGIVVSADLGYYTIKTAAYYKEQITNAYYPTENGVRPGESQFFTIGYDITDQYTKTVLDPTETNINACNNNGTTANKLYDDYFSNKNKTEFTYNNETYKYSYANKSYTGTMTAEDLSNIMKDIEKEIKHYKENVTHTTNIKKTPAKVKLEMLDATKPITIILNGGTPTNYTLTQLDGVVTLENGEYYIDLNAEMFKDIMSIDISYYDTTTLST